jgi:putative ABC transport system permease protein
MTGTRLLVLLARVLLPRHHREVVLGDLLELHAVRTERRGALGAWARTLRDLIGSAVSGRSGRSTGPSGGRGPEPAPTRARTALLADLAGDVRMAFRALARERGFAAVTIFTLALGIGSVTAVFGMVNQLLLQPVAGVTDPHGAAYLRFLPRETPDATQRRGLATLDFDAFRESATFVDGVARYGMARFFVSTGEERPLSVFGGVVYGDYFEVLGVRPSEGRLLTAEENAFGADPLVAVISEEFKSRLFGPSAAAVGRTVRVNDHSVEIVGVIGAGFEGAERGMDAAMWVPYPALAPLSGFTTERLLDRGSTMHSDLVVRLPDALPVSVIEERFTAILAEIAEAVPDSREYLAGLQPTLYPGLTAPPTWRAMTRRTLTILGGIVALVLLVACANVGNLLLFRNVTRRGRAAVLRALGASPGRIARAQLVQSLVLAGVGALAGLVVAWLIWLPLRGESLVAMPALEGFTVDARMLGFAAFATVVTTVLFGAVPAMLAGRFDLGGALRHAGRGDTGRGGLVRSAMAATQLALSLALLIGGVMLTRTVANVYAVDMGMDTENVATLPVELPRGIEEAERSALLAGVRAAVEAVPGVEGMTWSLYGPHGAQRHGRVQPTDGVEGDFFMVEMAPVTPSWFDVLRMMNVDGSPLRLDEDPWRTGEVVITASLARRLFGTTEGVVGRAMRAAFGLPEDVRVVAVTSDIRTANVPGEPHDAIFVPFEGAPAFPAVTAIVRASTLDAPMLGAIRGAVERALPGLPVAEAEPVAQRLDRVHSERRMFSRLLALLSTFAMLLAAVGFYGVVAFAVAGRRREFGVRIALGAKAVGIAGLVARYAASIVLVGTTLGLLGGYALGQVLETRLFGLEPVDAPSYALAAALLALTAVAACWVPTRRAIAVDPVTALKTD